MVDLATTPSGTYKSGNTLSAPCACASLLAGEHTYVTTPNIAWCEGDGSDAMGTVTFTEGDAGVYAIDDFSFGAYAVCGSTAFPDGTLSVSDVCNQLTLGGADQWGDSYEWSITDISGADMTISWSNTYGEAGVTVLTNGSGDWPALEMAP